MGSWISTEAYLLSQISPLYGFYGPYYSLLLSSYILYLSIISTCQHQITTRNIDATFFTIGSVTEHVIVR